MLEGFLSDEEKTKGQKIIRRFNEIVYGSHTIDWEVLYHTMNEVHNNFFTYLQKKYPQLDETEFKVCCLIYSDFSNEEIGIILKMTNNVVSKKRSSIRKKLGIDGYGNIIEFLKNLQN